MRSGLRNAWSHGSDASQWPTQGHDVVDTLEMKHTESAMTCSNAVDLLYAIVKSSTGRRKWTDFLNGQAGFIFPIHSHTVFLYSFQR
jgi:hypothetical protein